MAYRSSGLHTSGTLWWHSVQPVEHLVVPRSPVWDSIPKRQLLLVPQIQRQRPPWVHRTNFTAPRCACTHPVGSNHGIVGNRAFGEMQMLLSRESQTMLMFLYLYLQPNQCRTTKIGRTLHPIPIQAVPIQARPAIPSAIGQRR